MSSRSNVASYIGWLLALIGSVIGVVALVLGFGSSTNLAAAYGIAVTGTMAITTILAYVVARRMWHWNFVASVALFGAFVVFFVFVFVLVVVFAVTLGRRAASLLRVFAFAVRVVLRLAAERDERGAGVAAADLRFRDAADPVDALPFFATVREDFPVAFFRAAMTHTLHTRRSASRAPPSTRRR